MKIDNLKTSHLRNDAHFQFYTDFRTIVERIGAPQLKIETQYAAFLVLYDDEDVALKKIMKSAITAEINDADSYRDEIFSGMVEANKSALKHYDNNVREAAKRLKIVFDTYGNISRKPLDEETSAIYNILQDLKGKYAADAETVGLNGWIAELEQANETFSALMLDRYDESATRTSLVMKQVRQQVDDAYRTISERINASIIIEGEAQYADFVTTLNTVIKRYADILAQRKGKKKS